MISAVIITKNEERNIGRCIDSLEGVADEIVVVDSGSTDGTLAICQEKGVRVIETEWLGYAGTKNLGNDAAKGDYIFSIDSDEALTPGLKASILQAKQVGLSGAYSWNRLTSYCGQWIHHCGWYPDRKTRLFPKGKAKWVGAFVHETLELSPDLLTTHLSGDLLHYSYQTLQEHKERIDRYSDLLVQEMLAKGKKRSIAKLLLAPPFKFIKTYLIKRGFLDGWKGFLLSFYSAKMVYIKYRKLAASQEQGSLAK